MVCSVFVLLKGSLDMDLEKNLEIDDDEYERRLYEEQKKQAQKNQEDFEREAEERKRKQREEEKAKQARLNQERIELMKLKSGLIEEDEAQSVKAEKEEKKEMTFTEKLSNFWYHHKWPVLVAAFFIVVFGYITYDTITRDKPDITVLNLTDNGGNLRNPYISEFFEKFCDDFNGDGEVHVTVIDIPINPDSTDYASANAVSAKLISQFQSGEAVLLIFDEKAFDKVEPEKTLTDMTALFPENENCVNIGYKLTSEKLSVDWKWEAIPQNMYLGIRTPTKTLVDDLDEMQENYDKSMIVLKRVVEYLG